MGQLNRPAPSNWLSLRWEADSVARKAAVSRLAEVEEYFSASSEVAVLDLGPRSGANLAWRTPRLSMPQTWSFIDRDAYLLQLVPTTEDSAHARSRSVDILRRDIEDLNVQERKTTQFLTTSAVFNILSFIQLKRLAWLLIQTKATAFFSLHVTGTLFVPLSCLLMQELQLASTSVSSARESQGKQQLHTPRDGCNRRDFVR